ncbi:MAG TPA: hypothetical protein VGB13_04245 [Candidatus Krumholzibacteria bacterium]
MRSSHFRHLWMIPLAGALFATGCSEQVDPTASAANDIGGSNELETIDLDLEYGGLSYTNESLAFGDELLKAEAELEDSRAADEDEGDDLAQADPDLRHPDAVRIYLRAMWGRLDGRPEGDSERNSDAYERVDWGGTLSVDNGVIMLKKTILFEPPTDYRLPRDDRQVLGWASMTGPHMDGVLVCIAARPNDAGELEGSVSFQTGPLSVRFALADLEGLDEVLETEIEGNSVSFVAFTERPRVCPQGFLGGYWQSRVDDEHGGGWFRGRVMVESGRLRGYVAGRFGVNEAGEHVFHGKFINRDGQILGLLRGHYEPSGDAVGMGSFAGHWANRNGDHVGVLAGRYSSIPDRGAGFFHGMWKEICNSTDDSTD